MQEKFLPIGTVVLLKNGTKKIMITGYLPQAKDHPGNVYDYSACIFPEGVISSDQSVVFNHDQINQVIDVGYANEETDKFLVALDELVQREVKTPEQPEVLEQGAPETLEMPEMSPEVAPQLAEPVSEPIPETVSETYGADQFVSPAPQNNDEGNAGVGIDEIKPFSE